jgi:ABC-type anion transport system duplicated permease subunit
MDRDLAMRGAAKDSSAQAVGLGGIGSLLAAVAGFAQEHAVAIACGLAAAVIVYFLVRYREDVERAVNRVLGRAVP